MLDEGIPNSGALGDSCDLRFSVKHPRKQEDLLPGRQVRPSSGETGVICQQVPLWCKVNRGLMANNGK